MAEVAPYAPAGDEKVPLRIKTAIFMTLRNEDAERAISRFRTVKASVDATGEGAAFGYFVLSDTNNPDVAAAEEQAVAAWKAADPDRDAHHLPPPHRQHRLQGRQRARLLRALGRRLRADAAARRRQPDGRRPDRAPGAHDAGLSQDRHPAEPGGRHAVVERVRAHLPVRHAPRHALLHHGPGLVGRRLRSVLGPQRAGAHQAVPRGVPSADPARQAAARRPRARARPGGGDLDAPRRLRGARAAGGARRVGGEPADHAGVRPSRRALVPGQHAVREAARPAGALSR